jgi:hypothetical protein
MLLEKMMVNGFEYNFKEEQIQNLFSLGLNHNIGYKFTNKGINHNKIGRYK